MGIDANGLAFLDQLKLVAANQSNPAVRIFDKMIYNIPGKTKQQIEAALNFEIKFHEDRNPGYEFKECRQGKQIDGCILFRIVFNKITDEGKANGSEVGMQIV